MLNACNSLYLVVIFTNSVNFLDEISTKIIRPDNLFFL